MIFRTTIRLSGYLGEERKQSLKPAESPGGVHAVAAVAYTTARADEKTRNLSDRVLDQVAAEVLNEFGALELESILKGIVKVADSYLKLGFKLLPVMSTASGWILVG